MPITLWPHYADHPLALICRSRLGSYMPVGDTESIGLKSNMKHSLLTATNLLNWRATLLEKHPEILG